MLVNPGREKVPAGSAARGSLPLGDGDPGRAGRPANFPRARPPPPPAAYSGHNLVYYAVIRFLQMRLPTYHLQKVTLAVIILFVCFPMQKKKKKLKN